MLLNKKPLLLFPSWRQHHDTSVSVYLRLDGWLYFHFICLKKKIIIIKSHKQATTKIIPFSQRIKSQLCPTNSPNPEKAFRDSNQQRHFCVQSDRNNHWFFFLKRFTHVDSMEDVNNNYSSHFFLYGRYGDHCTSTITGKFPLSPPGGVQESLNNLLCMIFAFSVTEIVVIWLKWNIFTSLISKH